MPNQNEKLNELAKRIAEQRAAETQKSWDKGTEREPKPVITDPKKAS